MRSCRFSPPPTLGQAPRLGPRCDARAEGSEQGGLFTFTGSGAVVVTRMGTRRRCTTPQCRPPNGMWPTVSGPLSEFWQTPNVGSRGRGPARSATPGLIGAVWEPSPAPPPRPAPQTSPPFALHHQPALRSTSAPPRPLTTDSPRGLRSPASPPHRQLEVELVAGGNRATAWDPADGARRRGLRCAARQPKAANAPFGLSGESPRPCRRRSVSPPQERSKRRVERRRSISPPHDAPRAAEGEQRVARGAEAAIRRDLPSAAPVAPTSGRRCRAGAGGESMAKVFTPASSSPAAPTPAAQTRRAAAAEREAAEHFLSSLLDRIRAQPTSSGPLPSSRGREAKSGRGKAAVRLDRPPPLAAHLLRTAPAPLRSQLRG
eukprot:Hpha_TRINITY_DN15316_c6_g12::TRINITY_DN15316_c6_g12_i1::g.90008::m.90008